MRLISGRDGLCAVPFFSCLLELKTISRRARRPSHPLIDEHQRKWLSRRAARRSTPTALVIDFAFVKLAPSAKWKGTSFLRSLVGRIVHRPRRCRTGEDFGDTSKDGSPGGSPLYRPSAGSPSRPFERVKSVFLCTSLDYALFENHGGSVFAATSLIFLAGLFL